MPQQKAQSITGLILAGGAGSRLGGADKGWVYLGGKPLIKRSIIAIKPQVYGLIISANRCLPEYRALGYPLVEDATPGFAGPLQGMLAGLEQTTSALMLCVPVDAARLPEDLAPRLCAALEVEHAAAAVVHDGNALQPVCCLLKRDVLGALKTAVNAGEKSPRRWLSGINSVSVDFSDWPRHYWSINTPTQLHYISAELERSAA